MKDTIMEMPGYQRPYEKCLREGEQALSDRELLAVILRCGVQGISSLTLADEILNLLEQNGHSGLLGLFHATLPELMKIRGIGKVKAIQLKCIGELSKRMAAAAAKPELSFNRPVTIARYYMEQLRHEEQELLYCMMLDGHNHLTGEQLLSRGTANATLITPREVFVEAVKFRAVNLILVHNHPGGDPSPSEADLDVTRRIYETGEMMGIHLLDHIIIGDQKYISFREKGIFDEYI
ncbi:DNA repair protein RadC [Blautia luti]|uniref:RadC family protein n=1 Tax=Blautia luti TaxID=89014 RepID=UPI001D015EC1|nr:DNA repair protein RadC [Blautia luti]MCB5475118.1 DNA repair protein RadC [Blautia luti]